MGDISRYGGGPLPPHKSHRLGVDIDIRLMRNDGREAGVTYQDAAYSRALTVELIRAIQANGVLRVKVIYFNDPTVIRSVPGVKEQKGHDNHLHVRFDPPSKVKEREIDYEEAHGETDRRSPGYVRWVQEALNRVAGASLDGGRAIRTRYPKRSADVSGAAWTTRPMEWWGRARRRP